MTERDNAPEQGAFEFYEVDDYIDVYALRDSRRDTIDVYYAKATERLTAAFELQDHYYALYDVRTGVLPSPYAISISRELAQASFSRINQSVAIVTSNSFMMTFVRSVLNRIPAQRGVNSMFFKDFQAAQAWLKEERIRVKSGQWSTAHHRHL